MRQDSMSREPHMSSPAEGVRVPLMWSQEMYWYQYHLPLPVIDSAKIPLTIRIPGPGASEKSVVDAVRNLMLRHEALRTLYPTDCSGVPFQLVLDRFEDPLPVRRDGDGPEEVEAVFHALFDPPMDQSADLPLRLGFTMENQRVKTLVLLLNHISADGASLSVIRAELERDLGLSSRSAGPRAAAERRQVKVQPSSLARQQESGMRDARNDRALRHCEDVLSSAPHGAVSPLSFHRGRVPACGGRESLPAVVPSVLSTPPGPAKNGQEIRIQCVLHAVHHILRSCRRALWKPQGRLQNQLFKPVPGA